MSTSVGSIHYDLKLQTDKFDSAIDSVGKKLENVGQSMKNVGKNMTTFVTLPIAAGMLSAVKHASDLQETMNKVDVSFSDQAQAVKDWAKTSIQSMGLAQGTALDMAALFGDMSTAMGLNTIEAKDMSTGLVQLAADMASFKNVSIDRAKTALTGVYTGETEALKSLGIVMTQVNLEEFAARKGIEKRIDDMTQAEKVQLRYAYAMEVTKNAQGDFARTSDSTANKTRTLTEKFEELSTTLGVILQPKADKILTWLTDMVDKFQSLTPVQREWLLSALTAAAALGPLLVVLGQMTTSIGALIPILGNPAFWIVAAVLVALAAAVYLVYRHWYSIKPVLEKLRPVWDKMIVAFEWLKDTAIAMWKVFEEKVLPIFEKIWAFIKDNLNESLENLKQAWDDLKKAVEPLKPYLDDIAKLMGSALIASFLAAITVLLITVSTIGLVIAGLASLLTWLIKVQAAFIPWGSQIVASVWMAGQNAYNTLLQWGYNMYAAGRNWIFSIASGVYSAVFSVANAVNSAAHTALNYAYGIAGSFWNAGYSMVNGLADGIRAAFGNAYAALRGGLDWLRGLLPRSPAKEGPFSGKGWTFHSGKSMMEGMADGIKSMSSLPRDAVGEALSGMSYDINANGVPVGATTNNTSTSVNINGPINLQDQSAVKEFFGQLNRNNELARKGMAVAV